METTDWSEAKVNIPNHTYIVEDGRNGRCLGYIKSGTTEEIWFKTPSRQFDRRYRTFKELKKI